MRGIRVGDYLSDPEPFMGPVISIAAARRLLEAQAELVRRGGKVIVEMNSLDGCAALLSPGLIDTSGIADPPDVEIFGPLLQLRLTEDCEQAIREANNTAYGLAAGLLSDDPALWDRFYRRIRAGVLYWNRPTTGASGKLPFGGVGISGNHRPSGYFAADYCSYPVACAQSPKLVLPQRRTPGVDLT